MKANVVGIIGSGGSSAPIGLIFLNSSDFMKESIMKRNCKLAIALFFISIFFISIGSFGAEESKITWKSTEYPGLSFEYRSCLEYSSALGISDRTTYVFASKGRCEKTNLGNWKIRLGFFRGGDYAEGTKFPETTDKKLKFNGVSVVVSESKDLTVSQPWIAHIECNGKSFDVAYCKDASLPSRNWNHKMPSPLKEFLETVRCEK